MKTFLLLPVLISTSICLGCPNDANENLSPNASMGNKQGQSEELPEPAVFEEIEADLIELHTWFFTSGVPNNVIMVKHPNENAVFECKAISGRLWLLGPRYQKNLSVKPGDKFRWLPSDTGRDLVTHDYVEIIRVV
jgi:hypothetical protein